MDDAARVRVRDRLDHGPHHGQRPVLAGGRVHVGQEPLERVALDQLHHDRRAIALDDVEDLDDAGVLEVGLEQGLLLKARPQPWVHRHVRQQDLDGHVLAQRRVLPPIHHAHPASSDAVDDLVLSQALAGLEQVLRFLCVSRVPAIPSELPQTRVAISTLISDGPQGDNSPNNLVPRERPTTPKRATEHCTGKNKVVADVLDKVVTWGHIL